MATVGGINVKMSASTGLLAKDLETAGEKVKQFGHKAKGAGGEFSKLFGRSGEFTHVIHALEGAGAVIGLTLAAKAANEIVDKVTELAEQYKEGKISAAEMTEQLVSSLPVVGQFFTLGLKIHDAIAGWALGLESVASIEEMNKERAEGTNKALTTRNKILAENVEGAKKFAEEQNKVYQQLALLGVKGQQRELMEIQFRRQERNNKADNNPELLKAQKEREEALKEYQLEKIKLGPEEAGTNLKLKLGPIDQEINRLKAEAQQTKNLSDTLANAEVGQIWREKFVTDIEAIQKAAEEAADRINEAFGEIGSESAQIGLDKYELKIQQFKNQNQQATASELADYVKSVNDLKTKEEANKKKDDLKEFSKQIIDETKTNQENYAEFISQLNAAKKAGLLTSDQYKRGLGEGATKFEGSQDNTEFRQVLLSRTALGGVNSKDKIPIKGDEEQTELMRKIAANTAGGAKAG